ncbi:unnamed protein product [Soboliphyme baturini]|uniref:Ribonuclease P protein subunit p20 n=1 Tax=Soboliphyme baturini TaxID=241478 RepID=A0A183IF08_9BILA|nr:unnamed protein product [Soboliphyme baturini]
MSCSNEQRLACMGHQAVRSTKMDGTSKSSKQGKDAYAAGEIDDNEYEVRKRLPFRFPLRKNDVYVTKRTNFKGQMTRCQKLLDNEFSEVYIHGLGAAINRAINLALQIKRNGLGSLDVAVETATVRLTDDLDPLIDTAEPKTRTRLCSAVHIKRFHTASSVYIAVIGSGPAGFYCTETLLKKMNNFHVHMFEKLPVPYGLIRYGVAPDHPEVKNCIKQFEKLADSMPTRFKFYGNVEVGKDISLKEIIKVHLNYHH